MGYWVGVFVTAPNNAHVQMRPILLIKNPCNNRGSLLQNGLCSIEKWSLSRELKLFAVILWLCLASVTAPLECNALGEWVE